MRAARSTDVYKRQAEDFIANIADKIKERLAENGMAGCTIKKRVKSVYGIYRKMYIQNRTFAEIYDVYAVRIILDTVAECYNALGVIHDMYHPIPSRFKDYIDVYKRQAQACARNGARRRWLCATRQSGFPTRAQAR